MVTQVGSIHEYSSTTHNLYAFLYTSFISSKTKKKTGKSIIVLIR